MSSINFLQQGPEIHCLYCHFTIPREEFDAHYPKHQNTNPIPCDELSHLLDCGKWAAQFEKKDMWWPRKGPV